MSRASPDPLKCGARLKHRRGFCSNTPLDGATRCLWHGGKSTGVKTADGRARVTAGRAAWLDRMRRLKADGKIDRIPGGAKGRSGRPKKSALPSPFKLSSSAPPIARRAMRALAAADAKLPPLPRFPADHPRAGEPIPSGDPAFASLAEPVMVSANLRLALVASHRILTDGCAKFAALDALPDGDPAKDPGQRLKLLRIIQAEAHNAIKLALRVAPETMRPKRSTSQLVELVMRLRAGITEHPRQPD